MPDQDILDANEDFLDGNETQIYPALALARATSPIPSSPGIGRDARPRRNLTRWDDIDWVLRNPELFSSRPALDDIPHTGSKVMIGLDGDEHKMYRSLVSRAFSPAALRPLERDLVVPLIRGLLRAVRGRGRAELIGDVIRRFPVQVICHMLGVPVDQMEDFQRWGTDMILGAFDDDAAAKAAAAMTAVLEPIVADRRRAPRDDLISQLVSAELDGARLDDEGLYSFLRLLLPAGADTTWRAFGSVMVALLAEPDLLAEITANRSLVPQIIEETLRWETPSPRQVRIANTDIEIGGCPIEAGTILEVWTGSANHDESRFDDPEQWRPGRDRSHIAFGAGPHICIGINLARMELRLGVNALLDELPGLRLDPAKPAPVISGHALRGPNEIHVLFD
jgi:cytochrome P450